MMCRKAPETAPVVKEKAAEAIPSQDVGTKLISDATGLIKDATDSVASIKDEASATAALPKLKDITTKLGELHIPVGQASPAPSENGQRCPSPADCETS